MPSDGPVTRTPSESARLAAQVGRALNKAGYKRHETILRGTTALAGYLTSPGFGRGEVTVSFRDGDELDALYRSDPEAYEVKARELKLEHIALYAEALTAAGMRIRYTEGASSLTVVFE
jgi:hypothetical protein